MNARLIFVFACCVVLLPARAELLLYRESEMAHVTGAGAEVTLPVTTYVVLDSVTYSSHVIGTFKIGGNKFYAITNSPAYLVTQGIRGRLGSYTVIARTANTNDDPNTLTSSYFAKGRESTLDLGNGNTKSFPRSLKAVTRAVQISSGQLASYESTSILIFQSTETKRANETGDTAAAIIERLRQRFEAQGYLPAP